MKNIILCSDGTGNSGGICNSNVYRLFEALDLGAKEVKQVAFYDDGVGTQENSLIRAISGGMGVGLRKNVVQLYAALLHQYEPGDRIFLFGFSRGAFTVRVFANLLFHCGIADAYDCEEDYESKPKLDRKSPNEINELAEKAVAHYAKRVFCDPFEGANPKPDAAKDKGDGSPNWFREKYGLKSELNEQGVKGWFKLHFVGVWDTVEAYGLPIDELSDAFVWLFPLRFIKKGRFRENDLHPLIDNAYHALAIDDERHSFHPKLWIESEPLDPNQPKESKTKQPIPGGKEKVIYGSLAGKYSPGIRKVNANPNQKVEQVWFTGMHSNVGGSYPKDQLAHVPLNWMIEKAESCGLKFEKLATTRFKDAADPNGKMYDSRSGFSFVYRYRPRDLSALCADAGLQKPRVHSSALKRILRHTQDYAPTGIPADYDVEKSNDDTRDDPRDETDKQDRATRQQTLVDFLIWQRRILYVVAIIGLLALFATAWMFQERPSNEFDIESWSGNWAGVSRFVYYLLVPLVEVALWVVPSYLEPGVVGLSRHPLLLVGFGVAALLTFWASSSLKSAIVRQSNYAWAKGFGKPEPVRDGWGDLKAFVLLLPVIILIKQANKIRENRTINKFADWFQRWMLPKLLLLGVVCAIAFTLWNWFAPPVVDLMNGNGVSAQKSERSDKRWEFRFKTSEAFFAAPVLIEAGQLYHVSVAEDTPWKDNGIEATADGVGKASLSQNLIGFAKRIGDRQWFELMASIGPDERELIPIGKGKTFMAKTSGRLYLFVNDAYGAYGNNKGEATITVKKLDVPTLEAGAN